MNQSYVIATSTRVEISGVNLEKFDDSYFTKEAEKKKKKGEGQFFEAEKEVCSSACFCCTFYLSKLSFTDIFQLKAVIYLLMIQHNPSSMEMI